MVQLSTGLLHLSRLSTQTVKTNFSYLKTECGIGLESRAVSSISFLTYKLVNSNQLSESLLSCKKNSATIPTLFQLHKPAILLDPPWANWKQGGQCD